MAGGLVFRRKSIFEVHIFELTSTNIEVDIYINNLKALVRMSLKLVQEHAILFLWRRENAC